MKETVDVSVVCANHDNGRYLADFFRSFEASTVYPRELIFVDDGSTDTSLAIAEAWRPRLPFLKIVAFGQNRGFGNALNAGIAMADSPFLMRIDPDDVMLPNRIEVQHRLLASGTCDIVGSNAEFFHSETGKALGRTNFPISPGSIAATIRAGEHGVLHPTVMGRTTYFKAEPYVQANVPAEDYDVFGRMLVAGARFINVSDALMRYRVHRDSASNALPYSTITKTFALRDRIFGTRTSRPWVVMYYTHMKFYRRYLISTDLLEKCTSLAISIAFHPAKLFKRWRLLG